MSKTKDEMEETEDKRELNIEAGHLDKAIWQREILGKTWNSCYKAVT